MDDDLTTTGVMRSPEAQARGEREEGYSRLLDCYRSGQVTEAEWTAHLDDDDFRFWYERLGR